MTPRERLAEAWDKIGAYIAFAVIRAFPRVAIVGNVEVKGVRARRKYGAFINVHCRNPEGEILQNIERATRNGRIGTARKINRMAREAGIPIMFEMIAEKRP